MRNSQREVGVMQGLTLTKIDGMHEGSEEINFHTAEGRVFRMEHIQDCCESVALADVIGVPASLLGEPLLVAREDVDAPDPGPEREYTESYTWTFYTFRTNKGTVTLRWYGESNGYYSEGVNFWEVTS